MVVLLSYVVSVYLAQVKRNLVKVDVGVEDCGDISSTYTFTYTSTIFLLSPVTILHISMQNSEILSDSSLSTYLNSWASRI